MSVYAFVKFYSFLNSLSSKLVSNAFAIMLTHSLYIYLIYNVYVLQFNDLGVLFQNGKHTCIVLCQDGFLSFVFTVQFGFFFLILLIALYILMNMFYFLYVLHDGNDENFHLSFIDYSITRKHVLQMLLFCSDCMSHLKNMSRILLNQFFVFSLVYSQPVQYTHFLYVIGF